MRVPWRGSALVVTPLVELTMAAVVISRKRSNF